MSNFTSTKVIELGSCAFRQWRAIHSHCSKIHGYQLKAKFWFGCSQLDDNNWAADFGGLKELKKDLQDQFDHTLCVAADDPCLPLFMQLKDAGAVDLRIHEGGVGIERTAKLCYEIASKHISEQYNDRVWVEKVEVFEHEDNSAVYTSERMVNCVNLPEGLSVEDALKYMQKDRPVQSDALFKELLEEIKDQGPITVRGASAIEPSKTHVIDGSIKVPEHTGKRPAHVGPNTSSGKGDWFKGTTWG